MRIALCIYGELSTISGGYIYDKQLINMLRNYNYEIKIFSLSRDDYFKAILDNARMYTVQQIATYDPHVVVQDHLIHPSIFLLNYILRKRIHAPLVALVHHLRSSESHGAIENNLYGRVERLFFDSVDACIFNSYTTKRSVEQLLENTMPCVVAYPGRGQEPPSQSYQVQKKLDQFELLFVGNVIRRKGLDVLVAALGRCLDAGWHLTVVGDLETDREYVEEIRHQIQELGLQQRVTFLGQVSNKHLRQLYARCYILTVPSRYEGFGMVYLEALGFATPVIASKAGAAKEFIEDGREGFLVEPEDPVELARRIRYLIARPDVVASMGKHARTAWEAHPTWEETGRKVNAFLRKITTRHEH